MGSLVSAVGCTVLLTAPALRGGRAGAWEYRQGSEEGVILNYAFDRPHNVSRLYENRLTFNESSLSLQVVLQHEGSRLYRLRSQEEATAWFLLHVVGEWCQGQPCRVAGSRESHGPGAAGVSADAASASPRAAVPAKNRGQLPGEGRRQHQTGLQSAAREGRRLLVEEEWGAAPGQ